MARNGTAGLIERTTVLLCHNSIIKHGTRSHALLQYNKAQSGLLLELREKWRRDFQRGSASGSTNLLSLIDQLFQYPLVNIPDLQKKAGLTYRGAQLNVEKLVEARILREFTGNKRNRQYIAQPILDVITAEIATD